jgi:hypothetical protein
VFLACEPLTGKGSTKSTTRRTRVDWADFMQGMIDVHSPHAEKIVLVIDNHNTLSPTSFYEVFDPHEAERLSEKRSWKFTLHPYMAAG